MKMGIAIDSGLLRALSDAGLKQLEEAGAATEVMALEFARLAATVLLARKGPEAMLEVFGSLMGQVEATHPEAWQAVAERAMFPLPAGNA